MKPDLRFGRNTELLKILQVMLSNQIQYTQAWT